MQARKKLYMLIGLPGSGKSTWYQNNIEWLENSAYISTDLLIDQYAASQNLTYDQVYRSHIKIANRQMKAQVLDAVSHNLDIVWDQTNLTKKTRRKLLGKCLDYYKIAIYFKPIDPQSLRSRLDNRIGKTINPRLIDKMVAVFEPPSLDEGFNEIWNA